jgi:cell filamentation protein, protein adenylyltransferase
MDAKRFEGSAAGRLVPIVVEEGGRQVEHVAFVPNPLPNEIQLSSGAWGAAIDAGHHLGRLDAIAKELLPNPMLVARPTIRREAVSTSALEGTFAPAAEVLSSEIDEDSPRSVAVVEILNFIRATERGIALLKELPICSRFASELQDILIRGTPSEDWQTGKVRETQVLIGPYKGCSVVEAHYIPPPPGENLNNGITAWERWIHDDTTLHPVVRVALAHYQFEALHPYTDGNGRIGRLLAILQLIEYGLLAEPLINLSPYFEARADQYRHLLREVSATGSFEEWVTFFCGGLRAQAQDAESRIRDLLSWRDASLSMLRHRRVKGVALAVTEKLIEYPSLTVRHIAESHRVSTQAANSAVARLVEFGILEEVTGRSYNRVFQAPAVFDILFRPSPRGS